MQHVARTETFSTFTLLVGHKTWQINSISIMYVFVPSFNCVFVNLLISIPPSFHRLCICSGVEVFSHRFGTNKLSLLFLACTSRKTQFHRAHSRSCNLRHRNYATTSLFVSSIESSVLLLDGSIGWQSKVDLRKLCVKLINLNL